MNVALTNFSTSTFFDVCADITQPYLSFAYTVFIPDGVVNKRSFESPYILSSFEYVYGSKPPLTFVIVTVPMTPLAPAQPCLFFTSGITL